MGLAITPGGFDMAVPISIPGTSGLGKRKPVNDMQVSFYLEYPGKKPQTEILATPAGHYMANPAYVGGENRLYQFGGNGCSW